jgi:hypothetical protein
MEWVIESYDRKTDRDNENRFATKSAFIAPLRTYSATAARLRLVRTCGDEGVSQLPVAAGGRYAGSVGEALLADIGLPGSITLTASDNPGILTPPSDPIAAETGLHPRRGAS